MVTEAASRRTKRETHLAAFGDAVDCIQSMLRVNAESGLR
jgi:hypothetical protein